MLKQIKDSISSRIKRRRNRHLIVHSSPQGGGGDDNICSFVLGDHTDKIIVKGSVRKAKRTSAIKDREQEVLVATTRDSQGLLVWEKSSIVVNCSDEQRRAFEAARQVFAAKRA